MARFVHDSGMDVLKTLNDLYTFPGYRPLPSITCEERGIGIAVTLVRHRIPQKDSAASAADSRGNFTTPDGVASATTRAAISRSGWCFRSPELSVDGAAA